MYKTLLCIFLFSVAWVFGQTDNAIGPGLWNIISVQKHEVEDSGHYFHYDISKRRLSRKQEGYNATCVFDKDFDDSHAMRVDICKKVDGGCKPYQVLSDESVINFIEQHAKENLENFLVAAGVDPPQFPIAAGTYRVENFELDYCDLPPNGPYGEYEAVACILKGSDEVGCVFANVEFVKDEDDLCERNDK